MADAQTVIERLKYIIGDLIVENTVRTVEALEAADEEE